MADEIVQKLGLDASQALDALRQLTSTFSSYAKAVQDSAQANTAFNKSGRDLLSALGADVKAIADTVKALTDLQRAQNAAAAAADKVAAAEANAARQRQVQGRATQLQKGLGGLTAGIDASQVGKADALVQKIALIGAKANLSATQIASLGRNLNAALVGPQGQIQRLLAQLDKLRNAQPPKPLGDGLGSSFLSAVTAANLLSGAISSLKNAISEGFSEAIQFELAIARIKTIAGPTGGTIKQLGDDVRALSDEFGIPLLEAAAAQYELLSNQIGSVAEASNVAREAFKLANVTGSNAAQAVNAISSVLNAYNLSTSEAANVSAKLFKAVDLGRFTLDQVGNSLGRVTVTAAQLGVSIDEVLAAMTNLTITGIPADEAMTLLSNTMRGLLKPTKDMEQVFRKLGVSTAEAGIQAAGGLLPFLEQITEVGGDTASEIAQLTENVRVARGVLGLTGDQAERAAESLRQIKAASADLLNIKNQIVIETNAKQVSTELNQVKNLFIVDIGQNAVAAVNQLTQPLGGLSTAINAVLAAGAALVGGLVIVKVEALLAAGSLTTLTAQLAFTSAGFLTAATNIGAFTVALAASPVGLIAGLGAAIFLLGNESKRGFDELSALGKSMRDAGAASALAASQLAKLNIEASKSRTDQQVQDIQKLVAEVQKANNTELTSTLQTQEKIRDAFKAQIDSRIAAYERYVDAVRNAEKAAQTAATESFSKIQDLVKTVDSNRFQRSLGGLGDDQKRVAELNRVNTLLQRANELESRGTAEAQKQADAARQEAASIAESAANSAAQGGQRVRQKQAEDAINRVLQQQITAESSRAATATAAGKQAAAQLADEERRLSEVKTLEAEIKKIQNEALGPNKSNAERLATLQKAIPLAEQLEKKLSEAGNVDLAKKLNVSDLVASIRKPFLDQLGQKIELNLGFQNAVETLQKDLNSSEFTAKVKLVATGLSQASGLDVQKLVEEGADLTKVQESVVKRNQAIERANNAAADLPIKADQVVAASTTISVALSQFHDDLALAGQGVDSDANVVVQAAQSLSSSVTAITTGFNKLRITPELKANAELFGTVQQQVAGAIEALQKNPNANIAPIIAGLRSLQADQFKGGNKNAASFLGDLADGLADLATKSQALQQAKEAIKIGEQFKTDLNNATAALAPAKEAFAGAATGAGSLATNAAAVNTATAAAPALITAETTALQTFTTQTTSAAEAQERLNRAKAGATSGAATPSQGGIINRSMGGPIYRAAGGAVNPSVFKARGTDTIPAMLSPGEFVVNARSTRQFFSQLVSMNAGRQPTYRAEGGPVTHINIGDVNVNSQGRNGNVIGRDVWRSLDREIRRNTISLKRGR